MTGCLPPKFDIRDYSFKKKTAFTTNFPSEFSCKKNNRVKNQEQICSCVAHATSTILENNCEEELSTNFIYGGQFYICNKEGKGMYLRDACKIAQKYGDPLEKSCPGNDEVQKCYLIAKKALDDEIILKEAKNYKIEFYVNLKTTDEIKYALMTYGPVLASIKWYSDTHLVRWFSNGKITDNVLTSSFQTDYSYHAIMIYGWNEIGFLIQNSWGKEWGDNGCAILPYGYGVEEAKGLSREKEFTVYQKKNNKILNLIYKSINFIVNLFYNKF